MFEKNIRKKKFKHWPNIETNVGLTLAQCLKKTFEKNFSNIGLTLIPMFAEHSPNVGKQTFGKKNLNICRTLKPTFAKR